MCELTIAKDVIWFEIDVITLVVLYLRTFKSSSPRSINEKSCLAIVKRYADDILLCNFKA